MTKCTFQVPFYFALTIILLSTIACSTNEDEYLNPKIQQAHQKEESFINNYLKNHKSTKGFDGEIFCVHELLGGTENQYFIYAHCQEYYPDKDSVLTGTGHLTPAVITIENQQVVKYQAPGDGGAYPIDVNRIFPEKIAKQILGNDFNTIHNKRLTDAMLPLKEKYQKEVEKNYQTFLAYFNNEKKAAFQGSGTEPFWTLFLTSDQIIYHHNGRVRINKLVNRFDPSLDKQVIKYISDNKDISSFEIIKEPIVLEESNEVYPYQVIFSTEKSAAFLNGVGKALSEN